MRVLKKRRSAATVNTGMVAMMSDACEAEVSRMPRDSKKK